jgi:hopanoid biosynthesis associated radical SAM protein HpnJ
MSSGHGRYLRTLFLHPPSYEGFDGGAGSRYQARREIRSFWYPTWLAQPAALVPGSRLVDAPPAGLTLEDIRPLAAEYELAVLHTSTPSFAHDVRVAAALKEKNPGLRIGFVGAHVAVNPERALSASNAIDFVARNEFDFTIEDVARGRRLETVLGLSFRSPGGIRHTPDRPVLEDMDTLPFVVDVYKRDLAIELYAIGYLLHPYVSLYTGRGCRSKCTFCLWPQTVGGHRYRTRSIEHVTAEIAQAIRYFPQVREYFFDDDTLTDDLPRVEALARRLGKMGVTWSCNAKANVPYDTLKVLKDNGLRLLLVGYESGNQKILNNVRKGIRLDTARRFTRDAKELGIQIHGTFILGLPGETHDTIQETIRFAGDIDPHTIQVSIAAPYPGTELFREATTNGWLSGEALVDERGAQVSALSYPHLPSTEISRSTEEFYRRFYFRPRKIVAIAKEMVADRRVMRRPARGGGVPAILDGPSTRGGAAVGAPSSHRSRSARAGHDRIRAGRGPSGDHPGAAGGRRANRLLDRIGSAAELLAPVPDGAVPTLDAPGGIRWIGVTRQGARARIARARGRAGYRARATGTSRSACPTDRGAPPDRLGLARSPGGSLLLRTVDASRGRGARIGGISASEAPRSRNASHRYAAGALERCQGHGRRPSRGAPASLLAGQAERRLSRALRSRAVRRAVASPGADVHHAERHHGPELSRRARRRAAAREHHGVDGRARLSLALGQRDFRRLRR